MTDKERFSYRFHRFDLFSNGNRQGGKANRSPVKALDQSQEH
jgi:hypothetical protein